MRGCFILLALLPLTGCTVGPNYGGPPRVLADGASHGSFVRAADPTLTAGPGLARWWESLGDATLTALVDDALAHSPTIDRAAASIRKARTQIGEKRAGEFPTLAANISYLHAKLPGIGIASNDANNGDGGQAGVPANTLLDFYNLGGTASWEPDLFGGGRRGIEQARAELGQRYADLADAQLSLTAQVAQAYVSLRDAQIRQRLNAQSSDLQRQALELTRQRFAAGTASQLDVERLQNALSQTDADAIPLSAQIETYMDQLAVLVGRSPGALDLALRTEAAVPLPPAQVPIGDPAALIASRPDVRSAERQLAASTAAIGIQEVKRFPSVRFMGILGLGGTSPGDMFETQNFSVLLAPSINWSFLDFGRTLGNVRAARADRDAAEAQYIQTVLEALQDAENSLSRFGNVRQQLAKLVAVRVSAERAATLNAQRLRAGTSSTIDQLDIERRRLSAAIAVSQTTAQLTNSYIAVQKALGLGWSNPASR